MEKIFSGKTLDAAKREALASFAKDGIDEYDVEFEIIEQPVKKLFITKGEFRVKAFVSGKNADVMSLDDIIVNTDIVLKQRAEIPEQDFSGYSEVPEVSESDYVPVTSGVPGQHGRDTRAGHDTRVGHDTRAPRRAVPPQTRTDRAARTPVSTPRRYESGPRKAPTTEFPKDKVLAYVNMIIRGIGVTDYDLQCTQYGGEIKLNVTGERVGSVIGRHGEVLESIQCLAALMKNRCGGEGYKLSLDCNSYRHRRRKALEQIAERTAEKAIRYGKRITLDPMTSYERRVVHSRISNIEGATSSSYGSEPFRKVVVSPSVKNDSSSTAGQE
ncbi:hypothetical protein FACS1894133_6100 [Clostridia bacterium]|nr:hypothetical protein FACS1894133_6100 [Clostridia bacterium]